jgi:dynein light chain roadblock-type
MCTISVSIHASESTIIIPELEKLPSDLDQFKDRHCFLRTPNGWMTQVVFLLRCSNLLYQLVIYRQALPIQYRGRRFAPDGHISRSTYDPSNLLNEVRTTIPNVSEITDFLMSIAERLLAEISRKEGVLGTIVMTDEGVAIQSDFPESETNVYSSLVAHFVQRTKKALEEIGDAGEPEVIRVRSKKHEMVIAPFGKFILLAVQDPINVKK